MRLHLDHLIKAQSQSFDDIQDLWVFGDLSDTEEGMKNGEIDLVLARRDLGILGDDRGGRQPEKRTESARIRTGESYTQRHILTTVSRFDKSQAP